MDKVLVLKEYDNTPDGKPMVSLRCPKIGLTAYGETKNAAKEKLNRMFDALVEAYYKRDFE